MASVLKYLRRKAGKHFAITSADDNNNQKMCEEEDVQEDELSQQIPTIPANNRFEPLNPDDMSENGDARVADKKEEDIKAEEVKQSVQGDVGNQEGQEGNDKAQEVKVPKDVANRQTSSQVKVSPQMKLSPRVPSGTPYYRYDNPVKYQKTVEVKTTLLCFPHATGDPSVKSIPLDICAGPLTKPRNLLDYSGLFITNLSWAVTDEKLTEFLSQYGDILKITLVRRTAAHLNAGKCVLVAFDKPEQATRALHGLGWSIFDPAIVNDRYRPLGVHFSSGWGQKNILTGRALEQRILASGECADWRIFGICRNRLPPVVEAPVSTGSLKTPSPVVVEPVDWEKCIKAHLPLSRGVDRVPIRVLERGRNAGGGSSGAGGFGGDATPKVGHVRPKDRFSGL